MKRFPEPEEYHGPQSLKDLFNGPTDDPSPSVRTRHPPRALCLTRLAPCYLPMSSTPMMSSNSDALSTVLNEHTTIRFASGTDNSADLCGLDLEKNPQRTRDGFIWRLPDQTEATITLIGKVAYSVIGDKSGPYFNLPPSTSVRIIISFHCLPHITDAQFQKPHLEMFDLARAKIGFAIRCVTRSLSGDSLLPDEVFEHNQAVLDYLHTVREASDMHMDGSESPPSPKTHRQSLSDMCLTDSAEPNPAVKPFVKKENGCPFFIIPVSSSLLFPQFKGTRSPGVLRTKGQKGRRFASISNFSRI